MKRYRLSMLAILVILGVLLAFSLTRRSSLVPSPAAQGFPPPARILIIVDERTVALERTANEQLRPRALLAMAGVRLSPGDAILVNGKPALLDEPLFPAPAYSLQVRRAVHIRLMDGAQTRTLTSTAATLGQALAESGIPLFASDRLTPAPDLLLSAQGGELEAQLRRAVPVRIHARDQTLVLRSAAATVGAVLAEAGLPLQGFDTSEPAADAPLPPDGEIRVVRVQENVAVQLEAQPFTTRTEMSAELELDTRKVIQAGAPGLLARRIRTRLEDGLVVSSQVEEQWLARAPQDQVVGYGTKIVLHTLDTPDGPIQYWRKVQMYATSYSPCRIFKDRCDDYTALGMTLKRGVVAMTNAWCRYTCGDQVYVPGYGVGVVGDTGGGIAGRNWIDLGYSEQDYVSWHQWVTVYFLAPVPANYQVILP